MVATKYIEVLVFEGFYSNEHHPAIFDLKIDDLSPLKIGAAARGPDSPRTPTAITWRRQPGPNLSTALIGHITATSSTCYWSEYAASSQC